MARLFNDASGHKLKSNAPVLTAEPLAMGCWIRQDDLNTTGFFAPMCIANTGSSDGYWGILIRVFSPGVASSFAFKEQDNGTVGSAGAGALSLNTWHYVCAVFAHDTYRRMFFDGNGGTANTTSIADPTPNITVIGARENTFADLFFSGRIAEAAVWDLSAWPGATDADKATAFETIAIPALSAGVRSTRLPTGLVGYWPLWGDHSPEIDLHPRSNGASNFSLTVTGATKANHPPVQLYSRPQPLPLVRDAPPLMTFRQRRRGRVFIQAEG